MRKIFMVLGICAIAFAGFDTLDVIGHIPGAACATVEYHNQRLYAGAGASLFVYECTDPADMEFIGKAEFSSLVTNIIVRDDGIVFVGANHDGIYAVDASSPDFPIIAQYKMPDHNHWVADLEMTSDDTLWLSDNQSLKKIYFTGDTFLIVNEYLSGSKIAGAGFRDSLVAVCRRASFGVMGYVDIYNRARGGFEHVCSFDSSRLWYVVDAQFADNRDDIIYVLGGSPNLGANGDFYALHLIGDSLYTAARHRFAGIPIFAQTFIGNMTSRNDTVFLATMAAVYWHGSIDSTWSDCPALDGTCLPDSMPIIGHFVPGLWFFDVALHDDYDALCTGSEWLGVFWTSIADFDRRIDTIRTYPTGGWGQHSYLYGGDTLFIAMEGYGIGIFDVRNPEEPERISRIPGSFAHDMAFLDSIVCVARSAEYIFFNLAPWWRGGEIEALDTFEVPLVFGEMHTSHSLTSMNYDGHDYFILATNDEGLNLVDPADIPDVYSHAHFYDNTDPLDVHAFGDTIFTLMADSLHIAIFDGDTIRGLLDWATPGNAKGLCLYDSLLILACDLNGFFWYEWTGDDLIELGEWNCWGKALDVEFFDGLMYAVCAAEGLFILDIHGFPEIDTLAWYPGSQGWEFLQYGSQHVNFGPDSTIFLTDYHAGGYILEPFHRGETSIYENEPNAPKQLRLRTYPNPFNNSIHIEFDNPFVESFTIEIYDIEGKLVDILTDERIWSGIDSAGNPVDSGIYLLKATNAQDVIAAKVLYIK